MYFFNSGNRVIGVINNFVNGFYIFFIRSNLYLIRINLVKICGFCLFKLILYEFFKCLFYDFFYRYMLFIVLKRECFL